MHFDEAADRQQGTPSGRGVDCSQIDAEPVLSLAYEQVIMPTFLPAACVAGAPLSIVQM